MDQVFSRQDQPQTTSNMRHSHTCLPMGKLDRIPTRARSSFPPGLPKNPTLNGQAGLEGNLSTRASPSSMPGLGRAPSLWWPAWNQVGPAVPRPLAEASGCLQFSRQKNLSYRKHKSK